MGMTEAIRFQLKKARERLSAREAALERFDEKQKKPNK
jgi:hypothetical protein